MKLPLKHFSTARIEQANDASDLAIVPVQVSRIMISPTNGGIVILTTPDKEVALPLSSSEGTLMGFIQGGLAANSHIQTLPQMYIRLLKEMGSSIESVTLESKIGDVIYASIRIVNRKHKRFWSLCSHGDGLILSMLAKCPLGVVGSVWDKLDPFDDWPYESQIIDFEMDDDEYYDDDED